MSAFGRGQHSRRRRRSAALVGALVLVLAACGGDDDDPTLSGRSGVTEDAVDDGGDAQDDDAGGEAQDEVTVEMTDALEFSPEQVTIKVGGTVTWENPSTVVHTATGDPDEVADADNVGLPDGAEPWDSGFVQPGDSFSHTFTEPGTYEYVCIPHEGVGMAGTIVVEA